MLVRSVDAERIGDLIAGPLTWRPVVSSWLQGRFLATVPISSGRVVWSSARQVPGSISITVPRSSVGVDWDPSGDPDHPLAAKGQILRAAVVVSAGTESWTVPVGTFVAVRSEPRADVVRVQGVSMMVRAERDRLLTPTAPRPSGTLSSEFRRLLPAEIGLVVDDALTDRACPAMSWGESRIDALYELAASWPARLREARDGSVHLLPPLTGAPTPLATLTDGAGGTIVEAYADDDPSGVRNVVVARGQERDQAGRPAIQYVVSQQSGPYSTARYGRSVEFLTSEQITTRSLAMVAAQSRLKQLIRHAQTVPVTAASDPRWDVDDPVEVMSDGHQWRGWVSGVDLPLTVADGDVRIDVEVADAGAE